MAPDASTLQTDDHFISSLDALEEIYGELERRIEKGDRLYF